MNLQSKRYTHLKLIRHHNTKIDIIVLYLYKFLIKFVSSIIFKTASDVYNPSLRNQSISPELHARGLLL
jgi:hypothetical protein